MIKRNLITTYNGNKAYRSECVRKKNTETGEYRFFIKNKDAFLFNETWYTVLNDRMVEDHTTGKWEHLDYTEIPLVKGLINSNGDIGYMSNNPYKTVRVEGNSLVEFCVSAKIASELGYHEEYRSGIWYTSEHPYMKTITTPNTSYPIRLTYGAGPVLKDYQNTFIKTKANSLDVSLSNVMSNYSYGIEFETYGFVPLWKLREVGLIPLRDGSLKTGIEYATVVLKNLEGATLLRNAIDTLKDRTKPTEDGSLHIHIGNVSTTPKFIVAFYKLILEIQDELYTLFPTYKKTGNFKNKHYTKPLPSLNIKNKRVKDIDYAMGNIVNFLSDGTESSYDGNVRVHPKDTSGNHKWYIKSRYSNVNLVNLIYSNARTIEFRLHQSTTNYDKIINWLTIVTAIVKFAEENEDYILGNKSITLIDIIKKVYDHELATNLIYYIKDRIDYFTRYNQDEDPLCSRELIDDKKFKFKIFNE